MKNTLLQCKIQLLLAFTLGTLLCPGCQMPNAESKKESDNLDAADSLIGSNGLLAVPYLPLYIPANGYESPKPDSFQRKPFLLPYETIFSPAYRGVRESIGLESLLRRARRDGVVIRDNYHSSMFIYLAGDQEWQREDVLYAIAFYNDDSGLLYYVCDADLSDREAVAHVRALPYSLIELILEVEDAEIPSRSQSPAGSHSPVIMSFLTKGEPQVVVQTDAIPYHIANLQPPLWAPDWAERYMPGRKLIDSLVWGLAGLTCGTGP